MQVEAKITGTVAKKYAGTSKATREPFFMYEIAVVGRTCPIRVTPEQFKDLPDVGSTVVAICEEVTTWDGKPTYNLTKLQQQPAAKAA
jgi:hypothetical protein